MVGNESSFEDFNMSNDIERPFIETSYSRELPYQSKLVVYVEDTTMYFMVEKTTGVPGADGYMLIRQYLSALAGEND